MRVTRTGSHLRGQDFSLTKLNEERIHIKAKGLIGRPGWSDPCKLFIGNLHYDVNEENIKSWFEERGYFYNEHLLTIKLIRDYKTGLSKGYGFIIFVDPIYATSAMVGFVGQKMNGRVVNLKQGVRKVPEVVYVVKKKEKESDSYGFSMTKELPPGKIGFNLVDGMIKRRKLSNAITVGDSGGERKQPAFKGFGQYTSSSASASASTSDVEEEEEEEEEIEGSSPIGEEEIIYDHENGINEDDFEYDVNDVVDTGDVEFKS